MENCLACDLTDGTRELPGGRIYATEHWVVEHCIGPLGVGTLIVKPLRHCLHVWELTGAESLELGPLLQLVTATINTLLKPDQVYVCLWSHSGWEPVHLHFVIQPAWNDQRREHELGGPFLQADMFKAGVSPARPEVEAFAAKAREAIKGLASLGAGTAPE
jgi:diadenosine tetraphosphate (Ap4A) HIT family hydrolase